jgi:hypothetical protein
MDYIRGIRLLAPTYPFTRDYHVIAEFTDAGWKERAKFYLPMFAHRSGLRLEVLKPCYPPSNDGDETMWGWIEEDIKTFSLN